MYPTYNSPAVSRTPAPQRLSPFQCLPYCLFCVLLQHFAHGVGRVKLLRQRFGGVVVKRSFFRVTQVAHAFGTGVKAPVGRQVQPRAFQKRFCSTLACHNFNYAPRLQHLVAFPAIPREPKFLPAPYPTTLPEKQRQC
jgi:hypothetical protein